MAEFNNQPNDVVTGVERVKKGKGKVIAGITAGAIAVVAGGGAIAYAASDYVKNQVKLTVSSPENYYAWVNEKNSDDFAKQVSEKYRLALDEMKSGQKSSVSLKYEANDELRNLFLDEVSATDAPELVDIIENFNSIAIVANSEAKDSTVTGNTSIEWNGEKLVSFDSAYDTSAMDFLVRIPELAEQWIDVDIADTLYIDEETENYQKYMKDPESLITPDELETEIAKYTNLWNECTSDVELEKKADVNIADITVNYTVASVTLDETKAKEIAEKFLTAFKDDEIIKGIAVDKLAVMTADEYVSGLDDELGSLDEKYSGNPDKSVTLNTYIDATGCIRGVSFENTENDLMKFVVGKDGSEVRGEFVMSEDGTEEFNGTLTAQENNGKYSGAVDMTADGTSFSIEFSDLETVNEEKGYMNGVVTFVIPPEITDSEANTIVALSLSSDGNSQQISMPIDVESTNYGTIVLDISSEKGAEPAMPDKSGAFTINDETGFVISDYVEQDKTEEFIKNIFLTIGLNEEMADEYAKDLGDELYYDYSSDIDPDFSYDGNDDYGWDDDDFEDFEWDVAEDSDVNDDWDIDEDSDVSEDLDLDDLELDFDEDFSFSEEDSSSIETTITAEDTTRE